MDSHGIKLLALQLKVVLDEIMQIDEAIISRRSLIFRGHFSTPLDDVFPWISERLKPFGLSPMISRSRHGYEVRVVPMARPGSSNPLINLMLFLLTVASTLFVGAGMNGVDLLSDPSQFLSGVPFAATIMTILAVHEFGHYLISRMHGVVASLPYFIPGPTIIGTFGAVIKTKSPIPDRKSLLDIGAAGPLCGLSVALVALAVGMTLSEIVDIKPYADMNTIEFGDSFITMGMTYLFKGVLPEGKTVLLHPIAFAGWVGLLITAFNLMPIGQLDGGHVVYALIGRWHHRVAQIAILVLVAMGWLLWEGWFMWAFLVLILGPRHCPPLDDVTPLNPGRKCVALLAIAVFILCFVPVPAKM